MMAPSNNGIDSLTRSLYSLTWVNLAIWTVALIALIFVVDRCPGAKGMFVILAGGTGIGISLLSLVHRHRK